MHFLIALLFAIATTHSRSFRAPNLAWVTTITDPLDELAATIGAFTMAATDDPSVGIEGDLVVYLTIEGGDPEKEEEVLVTGAAALQVSTGNEETLTWACTGLDLTGLPLVGQAKVDLYISYEDDESDETIFLEVKTDIVITPASAAFTVAPSTIAENLVDLLTTITVESATLTGAIIAKITLQGDASKPAIVTEEISEEPADKFVITLTAGQLNTAFGPLAKDAVLEIAVSPKANEQFLVTKKTITVGAGPLFSIETAEPVFDELELPFDIEITPPTSGAHASNTAWTGPFSYIISYDPFLKAKTANDVEVLDKALTQSKFIITIDTAANGTLKITGPTTLWIYAVDGDTIDPSGVTPHEFKIKDSPVLFDVGAITINLAKKIATLTFTVLDLTADWNTTLIPVKLVWSTFNVPVNVTASARSNAPKVYTATDVDVSAFVDIPDQAEVVIHAAYEYDDTEIEWLPGKVTKTVTVEQPSGGETEWEIPETSVKFASPLKIPKLAITITEGGESWADLIESNDLVFRLSVDTGRNDEPVDEIIKNITMDGDDFFIPETDISTFLLEAPETGDSHTILVQIGEEGEDGPWLECDATIEIAPPAPTAAFSVAPTKVDLRTDTKASVVVTETAKPKTWDEEVHLYFSLTEVDDEPAADKFVKATKGTDKWTYDLTLADLKDIKKGDKIYVYVKHSVPAAPASNAATWLEIPAVITVDESAEPEPEAAMGVSPLLSLLAAALLLLVKLF